MIHTIHKKREEENDLACLNLVFVVLLFREVDKASMTDSFPCLCLSKVIKHPQDLSEMDSARSLVPEVYIVDVSGENGGQD